MSSRGVNSLYQAIVASMSWTRRAMWVQRGLVDQDRESHAEVVVRYDFSAVYQGFSISIPGVMWFTVRDGLIAKRMDVWDGGTFLSQIATAD